MVLIAMHPEGVLEFVTIYGKAPANAVFRIESATRLVVRKSKELRDSIMIEASRSSYELPKSIKSMLASPFTKCLSLLIYL